MPDLTKNFDSKFLKANLNVKDGDIVKFLDKGKVQPNREDPTRNDVTFTVSVERNGEIIHDDKLFGLNASNFKAISKIYGTNSDAWVGKEFEVVIVNRQNPKTGEVVKGIALMQPSVPGEFNNSLEDSVK